MLSQSEEKRKAREARFGTAKPTAPIDDEEARKRKAREERFGVSIILLPFNIVA